MREKFLKLLVKEVKDEFGVNLTKTFIDKVDQTTSISILRFMVNTSMNYHPKDHDCWTIGKTLQREYRDKIPFKTELEVSAGLWSLIYENKV